MRIRNHLLRFLKTIGEMLVVEDRHGASVFLKYLHALLEKFIPRVKNLSLLVARILAVLADEQHCINGEFIAAAAECLGDSGIDSKPEFTRPVPALFPFRSLRYVKRDDLHIWTMPSAFAWITDEKPVGEVLRVREITVNRSDNRNAFRSH